MTKKDLNIIKKLSARVEKGIEYLDEIQGRKKWLKKIDLRLLNLSESDVCIIGQVFDDFGLKVSIEAKESNKMNYEKSINLGFALRRNDVISSEWYDVLTHIWFCKLSSMM